ncbi:MAG: DUF2283 domain-containing protein [Solirubrobacteraceae bacterium]
MRTEEVRLTYDRSANAAYVALGGGEVAESVPLDGCPEAGEIRALHYLVLDFDREGRLVGVEVLSVHAKR